MATQVVEQHSGEDAKFSDGELAGILSRGFARRRMRGLGGEAWRQTVTQHAPEPWPAARLSLQARIAALDTAALD
ncbi:MAG: hypothetical protein JJE37_00795 [Methyloceanibacter sp.]|jgi:hypothetical protein|nr:hypothetical protein [Methyloceanibacter sp.]